MTKKPKKVTSVTKTVWMNRDSANAFADDFIVYFHPDIAFQEPTKDSKCFKEPLKFRMTLRRVK